MPSFEQMEESLPSQQNEGALAQEDKSVRWCRLFVVRHGKKADLGHGASSWSLPSRLTSEGRNTADQLASRFWNELTDCRVFACSPLIRAQETLFEMMAYLGVSVRNYDRDVRFDARLWSSMPEIWYDDGPEHYTNLRVWQRRRKEVEKDGAITLCGLYAVARRVFLEECGVGLVVSHGGPLDSAIMKAK